MDDSTFFAGLVPDLARLAQIHRSRCENVGLHIVFLEGRRSWQQQIEKYQQGRAKTAGGWIVVDTSKVVTHALPDLAPHCRGAAYDCAPLDSHEKIDWQRFDLFQAVAKLAPPGLVWGGTFTKLLDFPHYELTGWRELPLSLV